NRSKTDGKNKDVAGKPFQVRRKVEIAQDDANTTWEFTDTDFTSPLKSVCVEEPATLCEVSKQANGVDSCTQIKDNIENVVPSSEGVYVADVHNEDNKDAISNQVRNMDDMIGFVISSDSSHHSGANVAEAEVDSLLLASSSSAGGTDATMGGFSDLTGSDFLVGGPALMMAASVVRWLMSLLLPSFFAFVRGMEHDQLFTEFNVGAAREMSLSAEVRMRAEYNVKERRRLKSVVEKQDELLKVREGEIEDLKARLLLKEAEAAKAIRLRAEASNFFR
ncbi:hypothetical protein Tco_1402812, partial [Tanacetum coccineum]